MTERSNWFATAIQQLGCNIGGRSQGKRIPPCAVAIQVSLSKKKKKKKNTVQWSYWVAYAGFKDKGDSQ